MNEFYSKIKKGFSEDANQWLFEQLAKVKDEKEQEKIFSRIVRGNLYQIVVLTKKYEDLSDFEDIFSVGIIGLMEAANNYDLNSKIPFFQYSSERISEEVNKYISERDRERCFEGLSLEEPFYEESGVYTEEGFVQRQKMLNDNNQFVDNMIKDIDNRSKVCKINEVLAMADPGVALICKGYWGIDQDERTDIHEISDEFGVERGTIYRFVNDTRDEIKKELGMKRWRYDKNHTK